MDKSLIISAVLAIGAILAGLYSHKFTVALAAWFWLSVVHSGLICLAMGQAGSMTPPELPMLGDVLKTVGLGVDTGIKMIPENVAQMIHLDFANPAPVTYFVATIGILFGLVLVSFIVSSVLTGLASLVTPRKASAA